MPRKLTRRIRGADPFNIAVVLVPGAGPEDRIAFADEHDGCGNRRFGRRVFVDHRVGTSSARALDERRTDGCRILEARVVVGDDQDVAAEHRGAAHVEPLARITITVGAEEHQNLAGSHTAHRGEGLLKRVGRVPEVNEHSRP